jgi:hypothetical protein
MGLNSLWGISEISLRSLWVVLFSSYSSCCGIYYFYNFFFQVFLIVRVHSLTLITDDVTAITAGAWIIISLVVVKLYQAKTVLRYILRNVCCFDYYYYFFYNGTVYWLLTAWWKAREKSKKPCQRTRCCGILSVDNAILARKMLLHASLKGVHGVGRIIYS